MRKANEIYRKNSPNAPPVLEFGVFASIILAVKFSNF